MLLYDPRRIGDAFGADCALLVVETGRTSLEFDLGCKAPLHASAEVRQLWVVDVETLATTVLREPSADGFRYRKTVESGAPVRASLVDASLRFADYE